MKQTSNRGNNIKMANNVKHAHFQNRGFTFKGNKHQLRRVQSSMKDTFGSDVTVGKISSLLNNFAQVRWQITSLSGNSNPENDKSVKKNGRRPRPYHTVP